MMKIRGTAASVDATASPPSETIVELVYPFIGWRDAISGGELVCKEWLRVLRSDGLWRTYTDIEIRRFARCHERDLEHVDYSPIDGEYWSLHHKLLGKQHTSNHDRTPRRAFILCRRLNRLMAVHRRDGPDAQPLGWGDQRTLRQKQIETYRAVKPRIDKLREVFTDGREERLPQIKILKKKLLSRAQRKEALNRTPAREVGAEALAKQFGEYILAAVAMDHLSLEDNAFKPSFPVQASYAEILSVLETVAGEAISPTLKLEMKRDSSGGFEQEFSYEAKPLSENWPVPPLRILSQIVENLWIKRIDLFLEEEHDMVYNRFGSRRNEESKARGEVLYYEEIDRWWSSLPERVRTAIIHVYNQESPDSAQSEVGDASPETLRAIVFRFGTRRIIEVLHHAFNLMDTIECTVYRQHADGFKYMIERAYSSVYEGAQTSETDIAQHLLDIFLEVTPDNVHINAPQMPRDYTEGLEGVMVSALDRWNSLVSRLNDGIESGNFLTIEMEAMMREVISITGSFGVADYRHDASHLMLDGYFHQEYCASEMEDRFLYQTLATKDLPRNFCYDSLRQKIRETIINAKKCNELSTFEQTRFVRDSNTVIEDFRSLSHYVHTREHALLALIPKLQALSDQDCDRLVYGMYSSCTLMSPSDYSQFLFHNLSAQGLPCCGMTDPQPQDYSDLPLAMQWAMDPYGHPERRIQERLFCLPLQDNLIRSMCRFFVGNLYQGSPRGVSDFEPFLVRDYLERYCDENQDQATIVWDAVGSAIQNAVDVANSWNMNNEMATYRKIIRKLIAMCVRTRAKRLLQKVKVIYRGASHAIIQDAVPPFIDIVKMIKDRKEVYQLEGSMFDLLHMKYGSS